MSPINVTLRFERSTKGAHRFREVDANGDIVTDFRNAAIGVLYIRKSALPNAPSFLKVAIGQEEIAPAPKASRTTHMGRDISIDKLVLPKRPTAMLKSLGIRTLEDLNLVSARFLLRQPNFGKRSIFELADLLGSYGFDKEEWLEGIKYYPSQRPGYVQPVLL